MFRAWRSPAGIFFTCSLFFCLGAAEPDQDDALLTKAANASTAKTRLTKNEIARLIFIHSEFNSTQPVTHAQRLGIVRALTAQFAAAPRECVTVLNEILAVETSIPAKQFGHRLVAACYENLAAPDKEKAAQNLLAFAELRYGKDSERYSYFYALKEKGRLDSAAYRDLDRFEPAYAQGKINLAYWNMRDGDSRLQGLAPGPQARKQVEAVLQEFYASGLEHLATILGKEQRSQRKFIQMHAALYQRLGAQHFRLANFEACFENLEKYVALQGLYSRDMTAMRVWLLCADKAAELGAEATDFGRILGLIHSRRELLQNIRRQWENEKDEKTKQQLEKILRGKYNLAENELENWQLPGILFGDKT